MPQPWAKAFAFDNTDNTDGPTDGDNSMASDVWFYADCGWNRDGPTPVFDTLDDTVIMYDGSPAGCRRCRPCERR